MAVTVAAPFDLILEVYWEIFHREGVSPQLTWRLRGELGDSAFDLSGRNEDSHHEDIVRVLKTKTLEQALTERQPPTDCKSHIN